MSQTWIQEVPESEICIIGPSHMHPDWYPNRSVDKLFETMTVYSRLGLANFSDEIVNIVQQNHNKRVVWMVSHWLFNNHEIPLLREEMSRGRHMLPGMRGCAGNIDKRYMRVEDVRFLADISMRCIHDVIQVNPNVRLLFWCLYNFTGNGRTSSCIPTDVSYNAMRIKYGDAVIDIDAYLKKSNITFQECVRDTGGHPNLRGYRLIHEMLNDVK